MESTPDCDILPRGREERSGADSAHDVSLSDRLRQQSGSDLTFAYNFYFAVENFDNSGTGF